MVKDTNDQFALTWLRATSPSMKESSYAVSHPQLLAGHLELEIPFIVIRSEEAVKETSLLVSDNFLDQEVFGNSCSRASLS